MPFLEKAIQEQALVVFEHDPETAVATIGKNEKGQYCVASRQTEREFSGETA